jgi:transposase InsO family protein
VRRFASELTTLERIAAITKDSKRVLFDLDWPDDVVEQIRRHLSDTGSHFRDQALQFGDSKAGLQPIYLLSDPFMQTLDIVRSSSRLAGTPIVDAPTSWQYLLWKYEYDARRSHGTAGTPVTDMVIAKALQTHHLTDW